MDPPPVRLSFCVAAIVAGASVLFVALKNSFTLKEGDQRCWQDFLQQQRYCVPVCNNGSFALPGMTECHPWLTCSDIESDVVPKETIVESVVKKVYIAEWKNHDVVLSFLSSMEYAYDFEQNLHLLKSLGPNPYTVQLLGFCSHSIITEYHRLGSALSIQYHLQEALSEYNKLSVRLNLCISYSSILAFFHNSPVGVRVMCDSSTLEKTLSQYLLTDDLQLVVNDLDAAPQVLRGITNGGVVCGPRQLIGDFVAPEQLWPHEDKDYEPDLMPNYDEKTDVWKLPDVCNWFLGNDSDVAKFKLFNMHKKCKEVDASKRPTSAVMVRVYTELWEELFNPAT